MAIKKGNVNDAFVLLLESIEEVISDKESEIKRKTDSKRYEEAQEGLETVSKLTAFQQEVLGLRDKWRGGLEFGRDTVKRPVKSSWKPEKSPPTKLIVTFPSIGKRLDYNVAAKTFAEAIELMGANDVLRLQIRASGKPLLSKDNFSRQKAGGYFVSTQTSTEDKKKTLKEIADKLGTKIKVDIAPRSNRV